MEKVQMQSANGVSINIEKIAALFPNCVTETKDNKGNLCKKVDFEKLQEELGDDIIGTGKERYQFTWPDKRQAIHTANTPTNKTLRPCREESVDFDNTQNLYIEGDNLDVLKLLRENYLGKIKMIYIDPPYNTGNDFVYNDNFKMDEDLFSEASGEKDEAGNRMVVNSDSNGRFHTDWLNMMYPRLKVAKDLLSDDGVIFISIDENEADNLKKICDEIFGNLNFQSNIFWRRRTNQPNDKSKMIAKVAENILVYSKNDNVLSGEKRFHGVPFSEKRRAEYTNPDNDENGPWSTNPWKAAVGRGGCHYKIRTPQGVEFDETWYGTEESFNDLLLKGRVHWTDGGKGYPRIKIYLKEMEKEGQAAINFMTCDLYGSNQEGSAELENLFNMKGLFDNPKPTRLIKSLAHIATEKDSIVLDFYSGSSTSADSILQLNAANGESRKFIMVQIPEKTDEKSEAYKTGYPTISSIGKERIRRAAKKIKEEMEAENKETSKMDFGFRVLKLDSSNMEDVYYTPQETNDNVFKENNVKEDRTAEDLLFQVMPKCDLMLSEKIVKENIKGKDVYFVKDNYLAACFDKELTDDVIKEIAQRKPFHFVMREGGAKTDSVLDNFEQIFKTYSAGTKCMVI